jgi:hypothetical protein
MDLVILEEQERALAALDHQTFEVEPSQFAVRVYGKHRDDYIAGATIRRYGDRGWMSQIIGPKFYEALRDNVPELMRLCQVKTLEGYMTRAHARLLRMMLRGRANVEISHEGECAGRVMPWVIVSL